MLKFEEIKEFLDSIEIGKDDFNNDELNMIKTIANQIGFAIPNCKCKNKFSDLVIKLKIWLKNHPNGFCHYQMKNGVVKRGENGNIYNLNITDELAQWLIDNDKDWETYLKLVIPFDEQPVDEEEKPVDEEEKPIEQPNEVEPKKRGRKKKNSDTN